MLPLTSSTYASSWSRSTPPRPVIGYGGRAFNVHPELRNGMAGVFAGASALEAVETVGDLLTERTRQPGWSL